MLEDDRLGEDLVGRHHETDLPNEALEPTRKLSA